MGTESAYRFMRQDTGEIVSVTFDDMIRQDEMGYITLPDGVKARRVYRDSDTVSRPDRVRVDHRPIPPSDAMGFSEHQLAEFEFDRQQNHFSGVEFVRDPTCPTFYQVKCSSRKEWERYVKHRGLVVKNKTVGAALTPSALERAAEMVSRRFAT